MRYGPIAENALEDRMLAAPSGPRAMLDTLLPTLLAKAIMVATRLDLFEKLDERPMSARELGAALQLDEEMLRLLMRMLWSAGYVSRENDLYHVTPFARGNLVRTAGARCRAHVGMYEALWECIGQMEGAIRTGHGSDVHEYLHTSAEWEMYQDSMREDARTTAKLIVPFIPVRPGAKRLLDIAGSHGLYGAALCRAHPPLRSEVLDLPQAVEQARLIAQEEAITDVVTHRGGDALVDSLGEQNDVVLVNNVLHHFTRAQSRELLERARCSMSANATLVVWEVCPNEADGAPNLVNDGVALFFRVTSGGRCHSSAEYAEWLKQLGLIDIRIRHPGATPQQAIIVGRTPA